MFRLRHRFWALDPPGRGRLSRRPLFLVTVPFLLCLSLATGLRAQTSLLLKETFSREVCVHVGGMQELLIKEVVSREPTLFVGAVPPGPPYPQTLSRESSLCVATTAVPALVIELVVTADATGATVELDWSGYNELLQRDVVRYDVYDSDSPFSSVSGLTPYTAVGAGTSRLTITGLTAWQDHCFAVVAVDVLGQSLDAVEYAASYPLSGEVCSREVGLLVTVGRPDEPGQSLSREVDLVVGTDVAPARVTELVLTPSADGSVATLDWSAYNELLQRDVVRYDIYLNETGFTEVSGMTPFASVPAGTTALTITGLAAWQDRCFAVVAVDALGHYDATVEYSAAYVLSPQAVSREVSLHVGGVDSPPGGEGVSREVSVLTPHPGVPAPVTGVGSSFSAETSVTAYGAIDVAWPGYDEVAQLDVVRYRIYVGPQYFEDITAMAPYEYAPAGLLSHTVTGLTGDAIYYVAVVAEDVLGQWDPTVRAVSAQASVSALGEVRQLAVQSFADHLLFTWLPPENADVFLDRYRVYFGGDPTPVTLPRDATQYDVVGLEPAHGYAFRITTVDWLDTETGGLSLLGATWLTHPAGLRTRGYDGMARLTWDGVEPASLLQHYAVYVGDTPFTSVAGMTPVLTTHGTRIDVAGLTNGTEYYVAVTAVNLSGGERPEVTAVPVTPEPIPPVQYADLGVGGVTTPAHAYVGDTIPISWTVTNHGLGTTGNGEPDGDVNTWVDRVFLSRDDIAGNLDDVILAEVTHTGSLGAGESYAGSWTGALPAGVSGTFRAFVRTDVADAVIESPDTFPNLAQETSQLQVDPIPTPDLVAEEVVTAAQTAVLGDVLEVQWIVRHLYGLPLAVTWSDGIWLSRDAVFSPGTDRLLGTFPAPPGTLPAGEAYTAHGAVTLPLASEWVGEAFLIVSVDTDDTVAETDEANNVSVSLPVSLSLPLLPDLAVASITAGDTVLSEAWFEVRYRTENHGLAAAESPAGWEERILLSADPQPGGDLLLGTYSFPGPLPAPPGANGFERAVTVRAPLAAGQYWLVVQTDVADNVRELSEANNTLVAATPLQVESAYAATVSAGVDVAALGTPVPLSGRAWLFGSGQPATHVLVNLHIAVRGFARVVSALTDDLGEFRTTWRPLAAEGGHYTVGACHPGQPSAPVQDEFDLVGLALDPPSPRPTVVVGEAPVAVALILRNRGDAPVSGVTVAVAETSANLSAAVEPSSVGTLPGQGTQGLTLHLSASAAQPQEGAVVLRLTGLETGAVDVPLAVAVIVPTPALSVTPAEVVAAMVAGEVRTVHLDVGNVGAVAATNVRVTLPSASWLTLSTPAVFGPLAPGDTAPIELLLQPAADLPLGPYSGQILISPENGPGSRVPFTFRHVSDAMGTLTVYAVDEYTYFTPEQPRLAGATVTLKDAYLDEPVMTLVTDAAGTARFPALPEDYYQLEVSAPDHLSFSGIIFISAAEANEQTVFLSRQTVRYAWSVVPTEVEDVTEIVIEALFETNVPAPVVTIDPTVLDLAGLDEVGQTRSVNLTLHNHGWIAAENARFSIGTHPYYTITPLLEELGTLPARSSLVVPVVMTRVAVPDPGPKASMCDIPFSLIYDFVCGPWRVSGRAEAHVANVDAGCPVSVGFPIAVAGGPGGPGVILRPEGTVTNSSLCDECVAKRLGELVNCVIGFIPGLDCASGVYTCLAGPAPGVPFYSHALNCLYAVVGCAADLGMAGKVFDGLRCLCSLKHACDGMPGHPAEPDAICDLLNFRWPSEWWFKGPGLPLGPDGKTPSAYDAALAELETRTLRLLSRLDWLVEFLGDDRWLRPDSGADVDAFLGRFQEAIDAASEAGERISAAEKSGLVTGILPAGVDPDMAARAVERWNRSLDYWQAGIVNSTDVPAGESQDFIAQDRLNARLELYQQALADTAAEGFDSIEASIEAARTDVMEALTTEFEGGGVCARVRLQINQRAVQTRDAFSATLELENRTDNPVQEVGIELQVFDAAGQPVAGFFAIGDPVLDGIDAVDGTGDVAPLATGTAVWTLIPTTDAAPDGPTDYYIGGTLRYRDGAALVEATLTPAPITVYPQPELDLVYFHQRDVLGDDPWTDDVTEPSVPYELAVMVHNRGAGSARNLRLESAQPKIIDNEKGLLIDFKIIATEVAGEPLLPTLTADFGEVAPGDIEIGRWWLTSTLQGQFVEYSATFRHLGTWDDDRLSIIKSVEIRELIHTVRAYGDWEDGKPDFLVNAVNDTLDLPDALYLSDGTVLEVGLAEDVTDDGPVTTGHLAVLLTAAMDTGWTYLRTNDPGGSEYRLIRVERHNLDGSVTVLPQENAWQTDRTFIGLGLRPRPENILHLVDAGGTGDYTLTYQSRDQAGPWVDAFESPGVSPLTTPVEALNITFSEALDSGSFSWEDLSLRLNGGPNLVTDTVSVAQLSATVFRVSGLALITAAGGGYQLNVELSGITDLYGNPGTGVATLEWTTLGDEPQVVSITGLGPTLRNVPVEWLDVTFSEMLAAGSFDLDDVSLRRNGAAEPLGAGAAIVDNGNGLFRLSGLADGTTAEGAYELTVAATGVVDLDGHPGLGQCRLSWTMDTMPPATVSLTPWPSPGTSRDPVTAVEVLFSEAVEPTSVTLAALSLNRSGGPDLIGAGVLVEPLTDLRFRVSGFDATVEGDYLFGVDLTLVRDRAGNAGVGTADVSWRLDVTPPAPATDLGIFPDTGILASDGVTNATRVTLSGQVSEPALTVTVHDETADRALGLATPTEAAFAVPADLAYPGQHRLRVRLTDAAGNSADSSFVAFVDQTPPEVTGLQDDAQPQRSKTWAWGAADADSEVLFRYRADTAPDTAPEGPFGALATATQADGDGTWYVHVQATDRAGNESAVVTVSALLDNTAPNPPVVTGDSPAHTPMPTWTWASGGGGGNGTFRWQLDDAKGTWTETTMLSFTPDAALAEGPHTLYVQERDAAGNWSESGSHTTVVDAFVTVTFRVADTAPHGHLVGTTLQTVPYGGSTEAVTALPEFGFTFSAWQEDGVPVATDPVLTVPAVVADRTFTATFSAAGPAADLAGEFLASIGTADVVSGRGWWDLTGRYDLTVDGEPLTLHLTHDPTGKLSGWATWTVGKATEVRMKVSASVTGRAGILLVRLRLKGRTPDRSASVALLLNLALDPATPQLSGTMTGAVARDDTEVPVDEKLSLPITAPMDGTWRLRFDLVPGDSGRVTGKAWLTLSNDDVPRAYSLKGRATGTAVTLTLIGDPTSLLARDIRIRTTITPLEGGWARLDRFLGRGYGQTLSW